MHIDPARLEEVVASGATVKEICREFGVSDPTLYQRMKREPELKSAFDRGRKRAQGGRAEPELDATTKDVLEEIRNAPGTTTSELKVILNLTEGQLSTSLKKLTDLKLISGHSNGSEASFTASIEAEEAPSKRPAKARRASTKARKPDTKKKGTRRKTVRRASSNDDSSYADSKEAVTVHGASVQANGVDNAHAIEAALVELRYVKYWGAPSPHIGEVLNRSLESHQARRELALRLRPVALRVRLRRAASRTGDLPGAGPLPILWLRAA